jgi:hypothetical protein
MTRMTSFLIRLSVDKASKLHLFILYIALNLLRLGMRLVASGVNGGRLRMKSFWRGAIFYTLFSRSCHLSIHSTIQSSNISASTCFWHCDLRTGVRCFVCSLDSFAPKPCLENRFAHCTFSLSFVFLLLISASVSSYSERAVHYLHLWYDSVH